MSKKCVVCGEGATFVIKDSSDAYCESCAVECFGDTSALQHVEEQARALKELIKEEVAEELRAEHDEPGDTEHDQKSSKEEDQDSS